MSIALALNREWPLIIGAMISGAVVGDQSSPISDSVIVASTAAGCSPSEHFSSQLPYTLTIATLSLFGYFLISYSIVTI
ncbi:Na+/H+ antiporter NhaC family protein [Vibrio aestuarianus]|uniref:Na+/H+ antiporter NhaC family protein n=1 Tax=Vibrio aestuarianus TaxID=28171 RepID=UPI003BB62E75